MAPVQSRRRFWFGRLGSFSVVLLMLLSGAITGRGAVHAQDATGGSTTADVTWGTVQITTRDNFTDDVLTGACYIVSTDGLGGSQGCDFQDGLDGVTTIRAIAGAITIYTANPPSYHYYGEPITGLSLATDETKTLTIRHQAGGGDVIVKMFTPEGTAALNGCAQVAVNNNGVPGDLKSGSVCDWMDGSSNGVLRLNGVSQYPTASALVVMSYTPPGFKTAAPEAVTIQNGATKRAYFHLSRLALNPYCTAGPTSGKVGTSVKVSCKGFAQYQVVYVKWDGRSSATTTTYTDQDGRFTTHLTVPAAVAGTHRIVIASDSHRAPTKYFTVIPSLSVSPNSGTADTSVRATLRGFAKGEIINIRVQGQRRIRATATASSTGSASVLFTVPNGSTTDIIIRAEGSAGNVATARFYRTEIATAEEPAPATEATSTPEPTGTPTVAPTETPTAPPVDAGTPEPPAPTETAITPPPDAPTDTPSATEPSVDPPAQEVPATPTE